MWKHHRLGGHHRVVKAHLVLSGSSAGWAMSDGSREPCGEGQAPPARVSRRFLAVERVEPPPSHFTALPRFLPPSQRAPPPCACAAAAAGRARARGAPWSRGTRPGAGGACAAAARRERRAAAPAQFHGEGGAAGPGAESGFVVVVPAPKRLLGLLSRPAPARRHVQPSGAAAAQQQQQPAG